MKRLTVLTGAGMSAESGLKTFRDAGGLWEGYDIMKVASLQGWKDDPAQVLDFYNQRRRQLREVTPNAAHHQLVELEQKYDVTIVTQNVDDLHERAGSSRVIHLHGELTKARSTQDESLIYECREDIVLGDTCELGSQLRPHVVWFGELVPMLQVAAREIAETDLVLIVGTSMQVYPAAGLVGYAPFGVPIYYIDPNPSLNYELRRIDTLRVIPEKATVGLRQLTVELLE